MFGLLGLWWFVLCAVRGIQNIQGRFCVASVCSCCRRSSIWLEQKAGDLHLVISYNKMWNLWDMLCYILKFVDLWIYEDNNGRESLSECQDCRWYFVITPFPHLHFWQWLITCFCGNALTLLCLSKGNVLILLCLSKSNVVIFRLYHSTLRWFQSDSHLKNQDGELNAFIGLQSSHGNFILSMYFYLQ